MKIFSYIVIVLALASIIFNFTKVDFNNPFEGNSSIALIGIVSGFCAIFIILLFRLSKIVSDKTHEK